MAFISSRSIGPRRMAGVLTLLIGFAAILASYAIGEGWVQPHLSDASNARDTPDGTVSGASFDNPPQPPATAPAITRRSASVEDGRIADGPVDIEDGYIPDGVVLSPWDTAHPAIANLDPDLLGAVQQAATDAEAEGIVMVINSGWRSERYQQALLDEAVVTYGSEAEARKWVNSPDASTHVTGDGVDIGYTDAEYWLIEHGNEYGLCQTYANEIWHFELAVEPGEACPPPLRDATESG
jgi:zinc D-Ala-D-Ala carboxypeptidase